MDRGAAPLWELRHLRVLVAAVEEGSFTDAAIRLGTSQAAVSRTIADLEGALGARLLVRDRLGCRPTSAGTAALPAVRRLLDDAARLSETAASHRASLRLGYAWAALGRHTTPLMRTWAATHPDHELHLVRHNSPTAGLAEGLCDAAVVRSAVDARRYERVAVGVEARVAAFAVDDPQWAGRRRLRMADVATRTLLVDERTGVTTPELWAEGARPLRTVRTSDLEEWLDAVAAGTGVGTTAEATAFHHPRPGVAYRPISDGPPVTVHLVWPVDEPPQGLQELVTAVTALYTGSKAPAATGRARGRTAPPPG